MNLIDYDPNILNMYSDKFSSEIIEIESQYVWV
mgnify:CR=1 FL=1